MQANSVTRIGNALPPGVKRRLSTAVFRAYAGLAKTRAPYEYLFVLSHERAGSSLLALILGNHPQICGYGETLLSYQKPADLQLLVGANLFRLQPSRMPGSERYMMDKILYDDLLTAEDFPLLLQQKARIVFLIREPLGAIRSIMASNNMGPDEVLGTAFYIRRLDYLQRYAAQMNGAEDAFLLSYEDLTDRTESTLAALVSYLELQQPLSERYEMLRPMKGRSAAHHRKLHIGQIDGRSTASPTTHISEHNLQAARDAYEVCWDALTAVSVLPVHDGPHSPAPHSQSPKRA